MKKQSQDSVVIKENGMAVPLWIGLGAAGGGLAGAHFYDKHKSTLSKLKEEQLSAAAKKLEYEKTIERMAKNTTKRIEDVTRRANIKEPLSVRIGSRLGSMISRPSRAGDGFLKSFTKAFRSRYGV